MNKQPNKIPDDAALEARKQLIVELYQQLIDRVESHAEFSGYTKFAVLIGVARMIIREILMIVSEGQGVTVAHTLAEELKEFINDCIPITFHRSGQTSPNETKE